MHQVGQQQCEAEMKGCCRGLTVCVCVTDIGKRERERKENTRICTVPFLWTSLVVVQLLSLV